MFISKILRYIRSSKTVLNLNRKKIFLRSPSVKIVNPANPPKIIRKNIGCKIVNTKFEG